MTNIGLRLYEGYIGVQIDDEGCRPLRLFTVFCPGASEQEARESFRSKREEFLDSLRNGGYGNPKIYSIRFREVSVLK
mgnify:CR=1 FL=1